MFEKPPGAIDALEVPDDKCSGSEYLAAENIDRLLAAAGALSDTDRIMVRLYLIEDFTALVLGELLVGPGVDATAILDRARAKLRLPETYTGSRLAAAATMHNILLGTLIEKTRRVRAMGSDDE